MIEFLLEDRETGLYVAEREGWADASRHAQTFSTVREARTYAHRSGLARSVRPVARFQRDKHWILMPLMLQ